MSGNIKAWLLCLVMLSLVFLVYRPGLSGSFLFDDFYNLRNMAVIDGNLSLDNIKQYLDSQRAGILGRPISALSFLLDATDWPPASERPFKISNLIVHLVNSILLFFLSANLFGLFASSKESRYWLAFVTSCLWAVHPLFVSTTMYVIQRMAMLPATFVLLGMLCYLKGRLLLNARPLRALLLMFFGVWACTLLAAFSKENGVLLVFFIFLLEHLLLKKHIRPQLTVKLYWLLVLLPVLALLAAMIYQFPKHISMYELRDFNLYERLLTQPRMIFKYLYYLFVPDYLTEGVFNDGIVVSRGLLQPITTILSLFGVILLLLLSWIARNKYPLFAFAILFFFIGHILESSYVPLELYFEHRNYLPAMFLFMPIGLALLKLKNYPRIYIAIPVLLIGFLLFLTFLRAGLWGNNLLLHYETAKKFPESARAANTTAAMFVSRQDYESGLKMFEYGMQNHNKIQLRINRVMLLCLMNNKVSQQDLVDLLENMSQTNFVKDDLEAFRRIIFEMLDNDCYGDYGKVYVEKYLTEFENSELFKVSETARKYLLFQKGTIKAKLSKLDQSVAAFKNIIREVDGLTADPLFAPTAVSAIEFMKNFSVDKAKELADYYESYCLTNFADCDDEFLKQMRAELEKSDEVEQNLVEYPEPL